MCYTGRMAKTAYINARVDKKLKADAQKILKEVGVNTSDAVDMFLRQVVMQQGIPFEVRIPNKKLRREMRAIRAGKIGKRYTGSTKDILDQMLREA